MTKPVSPLTWPQLATQFDKSGNVRDVHRRRRGWKHRFRICSYDRVLLERVRKFLGQGMINGEKHPRGRYYRFEIDSGYRTREILQKLLPFLTVKKEMAKKWVQEHGHLENPYG
ncbi:MAG TPA: hypothetical protein VFE98_08615 [Candidatus Bathyarchaeia archaeon]|nr:hypothetical protein [Candidatus Bathyarchaeia archaeon]